MDKEDVVHIHNGILLSHKKERTNATCITWMPRMPCFTWSTWMDLEIVIVSEVSQTEKDKYHDIAYMWNLKNGTHELIYKTERVTDVENKLMVTKR